MMPVNRIATIYDVDWSLAGIMQLTISLSNLAFSDNWARKPLHVNLSLTLIFAIERLSRVDDVCAKLRQPALTTTFLKKVRFKEQQVSPLTPKLVFFVVAWTAVQQQRFANLVQFHGKLDIFHRLEILKVLKTKLVPDLGT